MIATRDNIAIMGALRARSIHGRLVLDAPTDLPEGTVVELVPLADLIRDDDVEYSAGELAALESSLARSAGQATAGAVTSLADVIARLRRS